MAEFYSEDSFQEKQSLANQLSIIYLKVYRKYLQKRVNKNYNKNTIVN